VVTGGGQGIGREICLALAGLGAAVVIAELSAEDGLATETLVARTGGRALFIQTDMSSEESVTVLGAKAREAFGAPDILVNNAILCPVKPVTEMETELWDRVLAVNLRGAFLTVKAFLPDMLAAGRGIIVNLVSTDAMPGLSAYIASKEGLVGFTRSLALEVGDRGVRVVALGPGMVDTPGLRRAGVVLAPVLGLTAEEFFKVSIHPAYEGLMPAADAGLATAYLVAELADEYHGEVVDGYTVLERAGYLKPPVEVLAEAVNPSRLPPEAAPATRRPATTPSGLPEAGSGA